MDENLLSARNVAEYAYCPRLFYLMEVEGIFLPNEDTEEGRRVHRRVDRPSVEKDEGTKDDACETPNVVRKLALTSLSLGVSATLDLVEISGQTVVPIEYRKGSAKKIAVAFPDRNPDEASVIPLFQIEPWPTDIVQIGLQAMLLEEAGYTVHEAVIYYAEEKRKIRIAIDEENKKYAIKVLEDAKKCAEGPRPLPLVNDPRCVKCSLQPVCLPDEINYQRTAGADENLLPRKIWPPRDDGIHVVAQHEGLKIGISGMELRLTDRHGKLVKTIPLRNVESLSIVGMVQITTQALHALADLRVPVAFLSSAGRLVAIVDPLDSVSAMVRKAQVQQFEILTNRLALARALISAKIWNQRTLLMRNHKQLPETVAEQLAWLSKRAAAAQTIDDIRGCEGQAAAVYFRHFSEIIKSPLAEEFNAHGRKRRPPPDPINACLSFGYAMLAHECVAALRLARLEPTIGAYHAVRPGRPALALDLMEPFRPLITDSIVISCFNRNELVGGHFLRTAEGCIMTDAGRRSFFNALGRRMNTDITHSYFEYRLSYRRMIILHARMIAAWLLGEISTLSFLTTR